MDALIELKVFDDENVEPIPKKKRKKIFDGDNLVNKITPFLADSMTEVERIAYETKK